MTAVNNTRMATSCLPSRHIASTPPMTVVKASRPATARPSIGTLLAISNKNAAATASASVRFSESTLWRHKRA